MHDLMCAQPCLQHIYVAMSTPCASNPCLHPRRAACVCDLCVWLHAPAQVLQPFCLTDATNSLSPCIFPRGIPHGCKVPTHETLSQLNVGEGMSADTLAHQREVLEIIFANKLEGKKT